MKISYLELLQMIKEERQPEKIKFYGVLCEWCDPSYVTVNTEEELTCFSTIISHRTDKSLAERKCIEIIQNILTNKEKEYLSAVIKPFGNKVRYLEKSSLDDGEYLTIATYDEFYTNLPPFKIGEYYKGMELNKEYTLEELGL